MATTIKGYSFAEKKMVPIVGKPTMKKYSTKTGRVITMACGKSKKGDKVCAILSNVKKPKK